MDCRLVDSNGSSSMDGRLVNSNGSSSMNGRLVESNGSNSIDDRLVDSVGGSSIVDGRMVDRNDGRWSTGDKKKRKEEEFPELLLRES